MSKQLKKDEWLYFFDLYEKNINKFKKEYEIRKNKKLTYGFISWFKRKCRNYKYNNDIMMLVNETEKSKKKNKGVGRPKKPITRESVIKELEPDLKDMMINDYLDIFKETDRKKYNEIINKYIKKSKTSVRKLATIFPYSKSTINKIKNNLNSLKTNKNNEKIIQPLKRNLKNVKEDMEEDKYKQSYLKNIT